jgi:membrane-associated protein
MHGWLLGATWRAGERAGRDLLCPPVPTGDSLLFATGALAALGRLNLVALLAVFNVAAILGDAVNYASKRLGGGVVSAL